MRRRPADSWQDAWVELRAWVQAVGGNWRKDWERAGKKFAHGRWTTCEMVVQRMDETAPCSRPLSHREAARGCTGTGDVRLFNSEIPAPGWFLLPQRVGPGQALEWFAFEHGLQRGPFPSKRWAADYTWALHCGANACTADEVLS